MGFGRAVLGSCATPQSHIGGGRPVPLALALEPGSVSLFVLVAVGLFGIRLQRN